MHKLSILKIYQNRFVEVANKFQEKKKKNIYIYIYIPGVYCKRRIASEQLNSQVHAKSLHSCPTL